MTEADQPQFADLLSGVLQVYDKRFNAVVLSVWWEVVKPYDLAAVEQALFQYIRNPDTGQFVPKPADVVKFIEGNSDDRALRAWALVRRSIGSIGGHSSVVFPDPLIHAVISEMGGWPELCTVSSDELPFRANEFKNRYRSCLRQPPNGYPRVLPGLAEMQNLSTGQEIDPPLLAGSRQECALVYSGGYAERPAEKPLTSLDDLTRQVAQIGLKSPKEKP